MPSSEFVRSLNPKFPSVYIYIYICIPQPRHSKIIVRSLDHPYAFDAEPEMSGRALPHRPAFNRLAKLIIFSGPGCGIAIMPSGCVQGRGQGLWFCRAHATFIEHRIGNTLNNIGKQLKSSMEVSTCVYMEDFLNKAQ